MALSVLTTAMVLGFSVLIATLIEGAVEILVGQALNIILRKYPPDHEAHLWKKWGLQAFSILVGIGVIFTMSLDIVGFAADFFGFEVMPTVSKIMTGFIVGRGASYVHNIFGLITKKE